MEQYTLIGHPLGHSMSPFIHERLFAMAGREASYTLTDSIWREKSPICVAYRDSTLPFPIKWRLFP